MLVNSTIFDFVICPKMWPDPCTGSFECHALSSVYSRRAAVRNNFVPNLYNVPRANDKATKRRDNICRRLVYRHAKQNHKKS